MLFALATPAYFLTMQPGWMDDDFSCTALQVLIQLMSPKPPGINLDPAPIRQINFLSNPAGFHLNDVFWPQFPKVQRV